MKSMKVKTKGAVLHSESFGDPGDPPILLIMGAMASGIWWPDDFCANKILNLSHAVDAEGKAGEESTAGGFKM